MSAEADIHMAQCTIRKEWYHKSCAWPEIADMNDLNSVIRVIKKLYRMSMENFQQSLTLLCGSLLATFVDV